MSSLLKLRPLIGHSSRVLGLTKVVTVSSRSCGWTRDWKPGPPPKTKEERAAAAKKYNLIPEDYEVYDETEGWGDYPKLPPVGQDARDPYEDFDFHYRRRNYGETLHPDYDAFTSERHDPNQKHRYGPLIMFSSFFGFMGFFGFFTWLSHAYDVRICQPMKPKQFPGPGKLHYTFEPLDS